MIRFTLAESQLDNSALQEEMNRKKHFINISYRLESPGG